MKTRKRQNLGIFYKVSKNLCNILILMKNSVLKLRLIHYAILNEHVDYFEKCNVLIMLIFKSSLKVRLN